MAKKRILVLFGPNILREVEKDTVGEETYDSLVLHMKAHASELNICCDIVQSNWEGELIDHIHRYSNLRVNRLVIMCKIRQEIFLNDLNPALHVVLLTQPFNQGNIENCLHLIRTDSVVRKFMQR